MLTWTVSTVPPLGAMISFSIFIASRINNTCPVATVPPGFTLISRIVPGIGHSIVLAPADGDAEGAAGAAAGAGVAAAAG